MIVVRIGQSASPANVVEHVSVESDVVARHVRVESLNTKIRRIKPIADVVDVVTTQGVVVGSAVAPHSRPIPLGYVEILNDPVRRSVEKIYIGMTV